MSDVHDDAHGSPRTARRWTKIWRTRRRATMPPRAVNGAASLIARVTSTPSMRSSPRRTRSGANSRGNRILWSNADPVLKARPADRTVMAPLIDVLYKHRTASPATVPANVRRSRRRRSDDKQVMSAFATTGRRAPVVLASLAGLAGSRGRTTEGATFRPVGDPWPSSNGRFTPPPRPRARRRPSNQEQAGRANCSTSANSTCSARLPGPSFGIDHRA